MSLPSGSLLKGQTLVEDISMWKMNCSVTVQGLWSSCYPAKELNIPELDN